MRGVRVGEASHPGPSSPRRLKREGPFRRCRPTQIDSDCEPLVHRGRFAVLCSDSDDEAETDFGQTDFGHNLGGRLWPNRLWPISVFQCFGLLHTKNRTTR